MLVLLPIGPIIVKKNSGSG